MDHSRFSNFFTPAAFKYLESSGHSEIEKALRPGSKRAFWNQQNARAEARGSQMRYLKYLALLTVLMVPLAYSQAQVGVAVCVVELESRWDRTTRLGRPCARTDTMTTTRTLAPRTAFTDRTTS